MASQSLLLLAFVFAAYFFTYCFSWRQVLVDGWQVIDVKNENVQDFVTDLTYNEKPLAGMKVVNVVRALVQVVSGFNYAPTTRTSIGPVVLAEFIYNLTIQIRPRSSSGQPIYECNLTIVVQPPVKKPNLSGMHCQPIEKYSQNFGAPYEGEIDEDVRIAADFGMYEVNRRSNRPYTKLVYKINSVQIQFKVCNITVVSHPWHPIGLMLVDHNCH